MRSVVSPKLSIRTSYPGMTFPAPRGAATFDAGPGIEDERRATICSRDATRRGCVATALSKTVMASRCGLSWRDMLPVLCTGECVILRTELFSSAKRCALFSFSFARASFRASIFATMRVNSLLLIRRFKNEEIIQSSNLRASELGKRKATSRMEIQPQVSE